ncbi:MAG: DUF5686 and carboxypeptidase regulatory-like domain-containing protein [bacterium]|nr:DUF5686 and carboxypeptidase regulatory-like domain-containing protein [bacterium]
MKTVFTLLLLLFGLNANAQIVVGTINDELGEPIPFSKVWVKSTSYGTVANGKGEFKLELEKVGEYELRFSAATYEPFDTTLLINSETVYFSPQLQPIVLEVGEVTVEATNKRQRGKELMKKVIDKRGDFFDATSNYSCKTYCFTSLDKRTENTSDTIPDESPLNMKTMNITEWYGQSYYKSLNRYKDVIEGYRDYSEKANSSVTVSMSFGDEELGEQGSLPTNPYVLINGLEDADINIFRNYISAPLISQRPLISPLAYNALLNYNFFLEGSFYEDGFEIAEVRVEPIFAEEGLFYGTLYINLTTLAPVSYELGINAGVMHYFKDMRIITQYDMINDRPTVKKREFIYRIKEGKNFIHGNIEVSHSDYAFEYNSDERGFWTETRRYVPDAFDKDTTYWTNLRPFQLSDGAREFIRKQDSIYQYEQSEEFLMMQDSVYNTLTVWDFLFNGVGFRNTFKKQTIRFTPLTEQVIPFGVGGWRHALGVYYRKGFDNNKEIELRPRIDYGFRNQDVKGSLGVGFTYDPLRFSRLYIEGGDVYDFVNTYESIQGTLGPANRVRNQKLVIEHELEVLNGLYLATNILYSRRRSIDSLSFPEWTDIFGNFQQPQEFQDYNTFMTEIEFAYYFQQRYIIKNGKKYITSNKWPRMSFLYRKGYPNIFEAQSDFDYLELGIHDRIDLKGLGQSEVKLVAGSFVQKKDLRLIENRFFRTSDRWFFSNPVTSLQMLDTALNTSNSFLQANFIHHFNGFFLNKIWGINKLGLEETIGGALLMVPESNFNQIEFYVGLERMFRIRKQLFKIGFYAVASDNNFESAAIRYKFGVNFYDSFRKKWDY